MTRLQPPRWLTFAILAVATVSSGCALAPKTVIAVPDMPKELNKVTMPEYVIEPPDVLLVDLIAAVPKPPYRIQPLDSLALRLDALVEAPLAGIFPVEIDGTLSLGANYGSVPVAGLTLEEAKKAIEKQALKFARKATADVALAQGRALQQVRGPHLVRQDGVIGLGTYGSVRVTGMTIPQARAAIEAHLSQYFQAPEISLDISGFNSKVYYVIFDGGGSGASVSRQAITGNETVLDAIGNLNGLSPIANTHNIWVSRPAPEGKGTTVLPVDWPAIVECGNVSTNYQLLPGDRLFVKALPAVTIETRLSRFLNPLERIAGFSILGAGTINTLKFRNGGGLGGIGGGGIGGF